MMDMTIHTCTKRTQTQHTPTDKYNNAHTYPNKRPQIHTDDNNTQKRKAYGHTDVWDTYTQGLSSRHIQADKQTDRHKLQARIQRRKIKQINGHRDIDICTPIRAPQTYSRQKNSQTYRHRQ